MRCLSPLNIKYDKDFNGSPAEWRALWKAKGFRHNEIPPLRHDVPCGKCVNCLRTLRNAWTYRLVNQMDNSQNAYFVTLTYNDVYLPRLNCYDNPPTLDKYQLKSWLKRFREHCKTQSRRKSLPYEQYKMQYFCVGEYGGSFGRPHYHLIFFNVPFSFNDLIKYINREWCFDDRTSIYKLSPALCAYTTKYMIKDVDKDYKLVQPPFRLMSRGLGADFTIQQAIDYYENNITFVQKGKIKYSPPRYVRDKMFDKLYHFRSYNSTELEAEKEAYHQREYALYLRELKSRRYLMHRTTGYTTLTPKEAADIDWRARDYLKRNDTK